MILSNNTEIDKLHEYKLLEPWLGQGLLTGKGKTFPTCFATKQENCNSVI